MSEQSATDDFNGKLLIVDDQVENLQLLVDIFGREGHEIIAARNGDEAVSIAKEEHPDLILLDINMPGLNGYEVCEILKGNEGTKDINDDLKDLKGNLRK